MNYKKIVESIGADLSNLLEKSQNEYINNLWENKEIPDEFQRIAEQGAEKVKEYKFSDDVIKSNGHPFIGIDKKFAEAIGLDDVTIVAYPRYKYEDNNFDSNFLYLYINHGNELMIDVYECIDKEPRDIYEDIMQELFNFFRDANWVIEGVDVYENHLNEMKFLCEELFPKPHGEIIE